MMKKSPNVTTVLPSKSNFMLNDFCRYGLTGVKSMYALLERDIGGFAVIVI